MAALVQAQRMLANSEATPDELIDGIPDLALTVIQAAAAVFELPEGDAMVCRAASAAATDRAGMQLALRGSISGAAILLNRTLRCDDAETDPRVDAAAFRRSGMRSVVATVVRDKSGPIGVIKLMDHRAAHFGAAEADCLELLAEALGAVIQRKRAEQDAQRALRIQAGIVRLQQQIASSPADLQTSMNLIAERAQELTGAEGASIAFVDGEDLAYRAVCGMAVARLGLRLRLQGSLAGLSVERDELLRCDDSETDPRVNRAACREFGVRSVIVAPLRAGDRVVGALRVVSRRTNAFAQIDGGTLQMLAEWLGVALHRDAAAEQLRSSEAQYRLLFAGHSLPMWVYDMETLRFLAVNDAAIGQYGFSKAEFLSMTIRDITPPAAFLMLDRHLAARSDAAATVARSWAHRKKDGAVVDVELSANTIRFAGRPARLVLAHNITERKRAERRLEKSEALLNIAARAARVGGWSLDLRDQVFSWSDELCAIHDLPPGSPCTVEEALAFYAPESRAAMGAAMSSMRSDGTPYDLELELISAGGRRVWVRTMGQAVRDAAGAIVGMQGALQDISEKRQAEEKVRTLAASLTTTLESITDAFYTVDRDWRFTYVNSEAERLFQRSRADLMGRVLWETFADLLGGEFERQYRNAVDCNSSVAFEAYYAPWQQWFEVRAYPSEAGLTVYLRDVNERHHEQEQLILLQTCVAWMRDVVIITDASPLEGSDPRIVFVNEAFSRHTGYSRDEVLGRTPRLLQGPKTQRAELDRISSAVQRCQPVRAEIINYTKSGVEYWVEIEIVPVWSGAAKVTHFIAVQRDTTERRLAQEALRSLNEDLEATVTRRTVQLKLTNSVLASKEEEIRSVVEHMADGVITFAYDGIVRSANSKVEAIFGHAPSELVGQNVSTLIPVLGVLEEAPTKDGRLSLEGAIARLGRETEGRHRNGGHLVLEVAISRYRIHGKLLWTAILRDIGQRVRNMADLKQARHDAEEASRAKSAFVATMSHEIRTPMNGVIGMIDVLQQTELAPDQSRMLGLARDSAHSLMEIIEDILDFSKIEAGKVELECEPISVVGVVEKACVLVSGLAGAKGVALAVRADPALPAAVWGDAGRLRQVLVNLVANAVKFSSGRDVAGSVSIEATVGACSADGVMVDLAVRDNGIGMDAAMIARLFTPFSQADASTTRRFGGTGLGLTISKNLVILMGGEILVSSTPDVGSVFTVRLPFTRAPAPGVEPLRRDAAPAPEDGPLVRPRGEAPRRPELVLVAEDNDINQQVIVEQLRLLGFDAEVVANGREALALWRSGRFAVLLTDLQMPVMDGYGLASSIRSEEGDGPRMPIIAVTANALKEEADRCRAAGMDEYLTKPVQLGTLEAMLQRWLREAATGAVPAAQPPATRRPRSFQGEPVDATVLPSVIGDDPALLSEFLLAFVGSAGLAATELAQAVAAADLARAAAVAHRLKSSARAVGAVHLGDRCEALETAMHCGKRESPAALLASFDAELARVQAWVDARSRDHAIALQGDGSP